MTETLKAAKCQKRGLFITFEGGEGAGKSTLLAALQQEFSAKGQTVLALREPGGTALGEELRVILKHQATAEPLCAQAELLLMYASRVQLIETKIKPALAQGQIVLCDRHDLSSFAYQGGGRGLPFAAIQAVRTAVIGDFRPDLTLLIDVPVEVGMQRVAARGVRDRFELEQRDFFVRVRSAYLQAAAQLPYVKVLDGTQCPEQVKQAALAAIAACRC